MQTNTQANNLAKITPIFPIAMISILVIGFLSNDLYLPSMPALVSVFHTTDNLVQISIAAWFAGSMSLQLFLGPVSDSYGRKPILLFSAVLLIIASLLCAWAMSFPWFLLGRILQGFAVSGIMVVAFAAVHEAYEPLGKATQMLGYVGMGSALAPICGPLLGGFIYALINWQANFFVVAIGALLLMVILYMFMPETKTSSKMELNLGKILYNYKSLLRHPVYMTSVLAYSFLFFAGGAFLTGIAFVYHDIFDIPLKYVGAGISPMLLSYMIAAGFAGKCEHRFGAKRVLRFAFSFITIIMIVMLLLSLLPTPHLLYILLPMILFYLSLGIMGPALNHISLSHAESDVKGAASALLTFIMMLGCTLGSLFVSAVYNKTLFSFVIIIVLATFASLISYVFYVKSSATLTSNSNGQTGAGSQVEQKLQ